MFRSSPVHHPRPVSPLRDRSRVKDIGFGHALTALELEIQEARMSVEEARGKCLSSLEGLRAYVREFRDVSGYLVSLLEAKQQHHHHNRLPRSSSPGGAALTRGDSGTFTDKPASNHGSSPPSSLTSVTYEAVVVALREFESMLAILNPTPPPPSPSGSTSRSSSSSAAAAAAAGGGGGVTAAGTATAAAAAVEVVGLRQQVESLSATLAARDRERAECYRVIESQQARLLDERQRSAGGQDSSSALAAARSEIASLQDLVCDMQAERETLTRDRASGATEREILLSFIRRLESERDMMTADMATLRSEHRTLQGLLDDSLRVIDGHTLNSVTRRRGQAGRCCCSKCRCCRSSSSTSSSMASPLRGRRRPSESQVDGDDERATLNRSLASVIELKKRVGDAVARLEQSMEEDGDGDDGARWVPMTSSQGPGSDESDSEGEGIVSEGDNNGGNHDDENGHSQSSLPSLVIRDGAPLTTRERLIELQSRVATLQSLVMRDHEIAKRIESRTTDASP